MGRKEDLYEKKKMKTVGRSSVQFSELQGGKNLSGRTDADRLPDYGG